MRRDRLAESQRLSAGPYETALLSSLYEFALGGRFGVELDNAFEVYWNGAYDAGALEALDQDSIFRWLEWFVHDYRVGEERKRPVELYVEGPGAELPEEFRELLSGWVRSTMGLYRVGRAQEGRLELRDLLREEDVTVEDPAMSRNASRGDLLVGRIYAWQGGLHLSQAAMLLPPDYEPAMVAYLQNAYANYRSEHPDASRESFLRANGHILMSFLLSARGEALRSRVGPGTRYADPAAARDKVAEYTRRRRREQEEALLREEEDRLRRLEGRPRERRTASGLVLLDDDEEERTVQAVPEEDRPARPSILIPGRDT